MKTTAPPHFQNPLPSLALQCTVFLLGFGVAMGFAGYTQNAWEDWYITFRASKNLALGNGLVFCPGQRIHSFTSPLGTLLPAFLSWLTSNTNDDLVLWLFRLCSATTLGVSHVLLLRVGYAMRWNKAAIATMLGLIVFDPKTVMFSINGMETAYLVLFLSLVLHALVTPVRHLDFWLAVGLAGLQYSRPDGFVYGAGLLVGFLLFSTNTQHSLSRWELLRQMFRGGIISILIYLPWVVWAWWYYGTPVPFTIIAKGAVPGGWIVDRLLEYPYRLFSVSPFVPAYADLGGWTGMIFLRVLALPCVTFWLLPGRRLSQEGRAVSIAFLCADLYLAVVVPTPWPWYFPCLTFSGFFVIGALIQLLGSLQESRIFVFRHSAMTVAVVLVGCQILMFGLVGRQMYVQQRVIEWSGRKQIGLWLKEHAATSQDTVFLECLGYIGYYSQLKTYDFPGMSSPEMVETRRRLQTDEYGLLIKELKPDWVILRPHELMSVSKINPDFAKQYQLQHLFNAKDQLDAIADSVPGIGFLRIDENFHVFQKRRN